MMLNYIKKFSSSIKVRFVYQRYFGLYRNLQRKGTLQEVHTNSCDVPKQSSVSVEMTDDGPMTAEIFPTTTTKIVPLVLAKREPVVLSFDEVPGPKSLKLLAKTRSYLSDAGTQITAGILMWGVNIGAYISNRKPATILSSLFDEYGPIVRFVSPIGRDIVLLNNPDHIEKVFATEGEQPIRSALDSLEKYRLEHRNKIYGGLYNVQGLNWYRQRALVTEPLQKSFNKHTDGLDEVCDNFVKKIYVSRDYHDEVNKNLYEEINKWAFDCMGLLLFSKKFAMLDAELVYSQCDMSWLYNSLEKSTEAILKCESGLHTWKLIPTPAWRSLIKYCNSLDDLIGKYILEAEQTLTYNKERSAESSGLINAMLCGEDKLKTEDIATILMDMLLIGINTVTTSMSFLLYNLAKHQKVQRKLHSEINGKFTETDVKSMMKFNQETPYLRACIKETLRLVPPIPILNRVLPKNITLDNYNIPRGTLIIMSTQDASLKENNFDDANKFYPERWLKPDSNEYHAFASIPFGFGARKCLGQNIAETIITMLTIKLIQKYKLEYLYGDIQPTSTFIVKPNKPLKIRFIDRM